ncbi:unnamed protein product [Jaminaea pallidilutea]
MAAAEQSSAFEDVRETACPCLNVRVRYQPAPPDSSSSSSSSRVKLADDGVAVALPPLVGRELVSSADFLEPIGAAPSNTTVSALRCLHCGTTVYAVEKAAATGPARAVGFQTNGAPRASESSPSPSRTHRSTSISQPPSASREPLLRPHDGFIYLCSELLDEDAIRRSEQKEHYSDIFGVSVTPSTSDVGATETETVPQSNEQSRRRPSVLQSQQRQSSYNQYSAITSQYGLQSLPPHLILSPPEPQPNNLPASSSMLTQSLGSPNPIAAHLEAAGLEKLKQWRSAAEEEIMEVVQQKRRELDAVIKKAKAEAESVLEKSRAVPAPSAKPSVVLKSGTSGRSRDSSVAVPERIRPTDRSSSSALSSMVSSASSSANTSATEDHGMSLPDSAFQRRNTRVVSTGTNNFSSSLSALSASFALRGKEDTSSMDDWAQKRRLKERYPEGDHSVMTSAATSADNSDGEGDELDQDEEDAPRGRGRQRAGRLSEQSNESSPPSAQLRAQPKADLGTSGRAPGTKARPTMAPSSLVNKSSPLTSVDLGRDEDVDRPRPGGRLGAEPPSPSAAVSLRRRNPPPSGAEPLKPATRRARDVQLASKAGSSPAPVVEGKKVAFAETPDQAGSSITLIAPDWDSDDAKSPVVETDAAVFDIDEELKEDGDSEVGDRGSALKSGFDKVVQADAADGKAEGTQPDMDDDGEDDDAAARDEEDADSDDLGGLRASMGAQAAGSFSALSSYLSERQASAVGEETKRSRARSSGDASSAQRSSSRSRDGIASRDTRLTSDYDAVEAATSGKNATDDFESSPPRSPNQEKKKATHDWGGRAAIGYRSIGDIELRLTGLLAPHAPSHRGLWTDEGRRRNKKQEKYTLAEDEDEDDDENKEVVKDADPKSGGVKGTDAQADDKQWSAWQQRARMLGQADAKRKEEAAMSSQYAQSLPTDRGAYAPPRGSVAVNIPSSLDTTRQEDAKSGFDREPKTSLPYQERQMVPSLRKATRRALSGSLSGGIQRKPGLPTIADVGDGESVGSLGNNSTGGQSVARSATADTDVKTGAIAAEAELRNAAASPTSAAYIGSPARQVVRGFAVGGDEKKQSVQGAVEAPGSDPHQPTPASLRGLGLAPEAQGTSASLSASASASRPTSASVSPTLGAGTSTPGSNGRRSPRPPYVPPPPPTSMSTVLQPDPAHKPRSLELFKKGPDTKFAYNEEGEEEETEWPKVLSFMHRIEQLKMNKRTGWLHHRVPAAESIADHMYRMAMLAMLCPHDVDIGKAVMLALVHDLAEAEVGDLTPLDGVSKEEKTRREAEALSYLVHDLLGSSPAALRIEALWKEYEERETLESKLVKDLDRFELILQATEYERRYDIVDLQPFFSCAGDIRHPRIRKWTVELAKERQEMWGQRGEAWAYEQALPDKDEERGDAKVGV